MDIELDSPELPDADAATEVQATEALAATNTSDATDDGAETDEIVISLGEPPATNPDDAEQAKAPAWVSELRRKNRVLERELKELRHAKETQAVDAPKLGPKPKIEDFDYDADKFEVAFEAWADQKRDADEKQRVQREAQEAELNAYEAKRARYRKGIAELPVADADDAHETVAGSLDVQQQGVIIHVAGDAAKLVYALGRNAGELERIKAIKDPLLLAAEIGRLETKVTTTKRTAPPPERVVKGGVADTGSRALDALRAKADKTGDYTDVFKYETQQRQVARK